MRTLFVAVLLASLTATATPAHAQKKIIEVEDGDLILVKDAARIRVVQRIEGNVRAIHDPQQHWIVVLVDQIAAAKPADGRVDFTFTFYNVDGAWPLADRWEGRATVDGYSIATEMGNIGMGINAGNGLVQLLAAARAPRDARPMFTDPAAVAALTFRGGGAGSGGNQTFDDAEQQQAGVASRNATGAPPAPPFRSTLDFRIEGPSAVRSTPPPSPDAPVRVGGNIKTPTRIETAEPVLPPVAQQAGVRGVVIIEATIGRDGRVSDARILRSIPLLDAAALDAVRKWRYEPTLLNGTPVPVIMTVTVNFQ